MLKLTQGVLQVGPCLEANPGAGSAEPFLAVFAPGMISVICTGRGVSGWRRFPHIIFPANICPPVLATPET